MFQTNSRLFLRKTCEIFKYSKSVRNSYANTIFTLLNSPGWLNTVTGNETGLTSEVISTTSLRTQPLTGCTTPPGSTPPILYEQQSGFFYVPQESTVFRPYPRRPQASWLPYIHFLAIACILRKRLVHVTGSNIFPDKHLWQILRWRQLRNLYRSYVLQNMLPSWRRWITCKNPSLLASRSALTTASKHSSWLLGSSPATTCKRLISACLGVL